MFKTQMIEDKNHAIIVLPCLPCSELNHIEFNDKCNGGYYTQPACQPTDPIKSFSVLIYYFQCQSDSDKMSNVIRYWDQLLSTFSTQPEQLSLSVLEDVVKVQCVEIWLEKSLRKIMPFFLFFHFLCKKSNDDEVPGHFQTVANVWVSFAHSTLNQKSHCTATVCPAFIFSASLSLLEVCGRHVCPR